MAVEIMSFGSVLSLFRGVPTPIKQKIAYRYKVHDKVLESWLTSLNAVRNICAHHSRLWNRELGYKPVIPAKNKTWKTPFSIQNNRVFAVLSVIRFLIYIIIPASKWDERFKDLLVDFPEIPLKDMGFPQNWDEHEVWK